jgi:hypothetical protein
MSAPASSKEVSIFNFAFLDIVAATIGVLLFVMALGLINSTGSIVTRGLDAELSNTVTQTQAALANSSQWANAAAALSSAITNILTGGSLVTTALTNALEQQLILSQQLASAQAACSNTVLTVTILSNQITAAERRPVEEPRRTTISYRVPRLRETDKESIDFECDHGRVYLFAEKNRLNEDDYNKEIIGIASGGGHIVASVTRRPAARGETYDEATRANSAFQRILARNPAQRYYVSFKVRSNSYPFYRRLRDALWSRGYEVNWRAYENDERINIGIGGTGPRRPGEVQGF